MGKINKTYTILALIIFLHLGIMLLLRFFPYPEMFIYSYLTSEGLIPYKEIFDQHFPGLMFLPINFYSIGIDTVNEYRIIHLLLISLNHLLLFKLAKKLFFSNKKALILNGAYLIWQPFFEGFVLWIDSFIPPILILTVYYLLDWLENKNINLLIVSGFLVSVAFVFKQVMAPLSLLLILFIYIQRRKVIDVLYFLIGMAPLLILINLYFLYLDAWNDFFFWTYTFNMTTFKEMGRTFPTQTDLIKVFPVFIAAVISSAYLLVESKTPKNILLIIFFFGSLVFAYARFDFIHLQPALPFALIILFIGLQKLKYQTRNILLVVLLLLSMLPLFRMYKYLYSPGYVPLFTDTEFAVFNRVEELTNPGDKTFVYAGSPHMYPFTGTIPAGEQFVFQFPWFMVEAEDKILYGMQNDPPNVVVRSEGATTGGVSLVKYMQKIGQYVDLNYKVVDKIDRFEIMVRKDYENSN